MAGDGLLAADGAAGGGAEPDMMNQYDAIVVGVGAMGASACYQLARGARGCWGWSSLAFRTRWAARMGIRG